MYATNLSESDSGTATLVLMVAVTVVLAAVIGSFVLLSGAVSAEETNESEYNVTIEATDPGDAEELDVVIDGNSTNHSLINRSIESNKTHLSVDSTAEWQQGFVRNTTVSNGEVTVNDSQGYVTENISIGDGERLTSVTVNVTDPKDGLEVLVYQDSTLGMNSPSGEYLALVSTSGSTTLTIPEGTANTTANYTITLAAENTSAPPVIDSVTVEGDEEVVGYNDYTASIEANSTVMVNAVDGSGTVVGNASTVVSEGDVTLSPGSATVEYTESQPSSIVVIGDDSTDLTTTQMAGIGVLVVVVLGILLVGSRD